MQAVKDGSGVIRLAPGLYELTPTEWTVLAASGATYTEKAVLALDGQTLIGGGRSNTIILSEGDPYGFDGKIITQGTSALRNLSIAYEGLTAIDSRGDLTMCTADIYCHNPNPTAGGEGIYYCPNSKGQHILQLYDCQVVGDRDTQWSCGLYICNGCAWEPLSTFPKVIVQCNSWIWKWSCGLYWTEWSNEGEITADYDCESFAENSEEGAAYEDSDGNWVTLCP